jgi:hypothetical protein
METIVFFMLYCLGLLVLILKRRFLRMCYAIATSHDGSSST